jgi:DNA-binding transcriptional regulator LsrR (DeoR family)
MAMSRPKRFYRNMTPQIAREIRQRYFDRQMNQRQLADAYGIKQNTVSRIVSNQVWNV